LWTLQLSYQAEVCAGLRSQDKFLQPPEVEEELWLVLHHRVCLNGPFQFVIDVQAKELEAFHPVYCVPIGE
jgi:hypothetical protein